MKTATGNALLRAYSKAAKNLQQDGMMAATTVSAGFIIPDGQKRGEREGYQVFVRVIRWSQAMKRLKPESGGLLSDL